MSQNFNQGELMQQHEFHQDMVQLISNLNAAIININMYSTNHPQAKRYLETAYLNLSDLLREKKKITLLVIDENIIVDNCSLKTKGPHLTQFNRILKKSAIERLTFITGLPMPNFMELIQFLSADESKPIRSNQFIKLGIIDLKVKEKLSETSTRASEEQVEQLQELKELRDLKKDELQALYQDIKHHKRMDIRGVEDVIKAFIDGFDREINPLELLASPKSTDEYAFSHAVNVSILTLSQAESFGMTGQHLYDIGISSVMHDIGKLFIPDEIINKPDALTTQERKVMESHTVMGAQQLLQMKNIPHLAVLGALEHHLQYDGTGYPSLRAGWKPHVVSQMIAVSDIFDVHRSRRPDSDPKSMNMTEETIADEKGMTFHPIFVDNFLELINR
jgi:HD-GYP domain-containing protein (c-di-GMP phosphodiesterase class II)